VYYREPHHCFGFAARVPVWSAILLPSRVGRDSGPANRPNPTNQSDYRLAKTEKEREAKDDYGYGNVKRGVHWNVRNLSQGRGNGGQTFQSHTEQRTISQAGEAEPGIVTGFGVLTHEKRSANSGA
jgi:hypothetical protein